MTSDQALLSVRGLRKDYPVGRGLLGRSRRNLTAVAGISLDIKTGEILGLVGESGCGKSTLGRCVLLLEPPTAGEIVFCGEHLTALPRPRLRQMRRQAQMIFQDPYSSLNPRRTIGDSIAEAYAVHGLLTRTERRDRTREHLAAVGLPTSAADRYPHELSGGQRQRVAIARAMALDPSLIVADEAVSALDVSIQAQVLNLMLALQRERGFSCLFISHDLGVVRQVSDRVAVMYLGRIVETGPRDAIFARPMHPYTCALLQAVPRPRLQRRERRTLSGEVPSALEPPRGCPFHTRCPKRQTRCTTETPRLAPGQPDHAVACFYPENA